jgi:hypothetical protein
MLDFTISPQVENVHWVRMPKPKERPIGLFRTKNLDLIEEGVIKRVVIRKRHAFRRIRIVFFPSLLDHVERLHKEQEDSKRTTHPINKFS